MVSHLVTKYPTLYPQAKLSLLESLENEGIMMTDNVEKAYPQDLIVNKKILQKVNQTMNQVFKGD